MTTLPLPPEIAALTTSLAAAEGEARWFLGDLVLIKLTGRETGGRLAVLEFTGAQGGGPPPHNHQREDELFFLLEGEMTFHVDGRAFDVKPGHLALAPKGLPHHYVVKSPTARWLVLTFPAGFEDFVRDLSDPAGELRLPRPGEPQGDMDSFPAVAARYGIDLV